MQNIWRQKLQSQILASLGLTHYFIIMRELQWMIFAHQNSHSEHYLLLRLAL